MTPDEFQQLVAALQAHSDRLETVVQRQLAVESALEQKLSSNEHQMAALQTVIQGLLLDKQSRPGPSPSQPENSARNEDIFLQTQAMIDAKMQDIQRALNRLSGPSQAAPAETTLDGAPTRDASELRRDDGSRPAKTGKEVRPPPISTQPDFLPNAGRDVKMKDVKPFNGDSSQFETFWTSLVTFFEVQPRMFQDSDFRKVAYTLSCLEGPPRDWLASLISRSRQGDAEAFATVHDFERFSEEIWELYRDPNSDLAANALLEALREDACVDLREYFTRFEELFHRSANCPGTSRDKLARLKHGLSVKSIRLLLDNALVLPELEVDYAKVKWFLLTRMSNNAACTTLASGRKTATSNAATSSGSSFKAHVGGNSGSQHRWNRHRPPQANLSPSVTPTPASAFPSAVPMDISMVSGLDNWVKARIRRCQAKKSCYICDADTHSSGACPDFNKAPESVRRSIAKIEQELPSDKYFISSVLSSLSETSMRIPLQIGSKTITALVDTGAEGHLYIRDEIARECHIPRTLASPPLVLAGYEGTVVETAFQQTAPVRTIIHGKSFSMVFRIVRSMKVDVIIGHQWLKEHGALLNLRDNSLTFLEDLPQTSHPPTSRAIPTVPSSATAAPVPVSIQMMSMSGFRKFARKEKLKVQSVHIHVKKREPDSTLASLGTSSLSNTVPVAATDTPSSIQIPPYLQDLASVFDEDRAKRLPEYRDDFALDIEMLPGAKLPSGRIYSLSQREQAALLLELEKGLASGHIVRSKASGGCPVLFVKKGDGSLRMCVDYRALNEATKSIKAALPLIPDLVNTVQGFKIFTKLDLKSAFNLLRIKKGAEPLTAFTTRYGLFEYRVVPFGLKNAPGHFQAFINDLFKDLIDRGLVAFIDDLLIYSNDIEEHRRLVRLVLQRLLDAGMVVGLSKCLFEVPEVTFVGVKISGDGLSIHQDKLSPILAFARPRTKKQLRSFLGMTVQFRQFIPRYSAIVSPLTALTSPKADFAWSPDCDAAFAAIKLAFEAEHFLIPANPQAQFFLQSDASDFALGAVLRQKDGNGVLRPIAFHSRKFTKEEINYAIYDKELQAILDSFSVWRHWLIDTPIPIEIQCDHRNLTFYRDPQKLSRRQARNAEFLADFNYKLVYTKGSHMHIADCLSRAPNLSTHQGDPEREVNVRQMLPQTAFAESSLDTVTLAPLFPTDDSHIQEPNSVPPVDINGSSPWLSNFGLTADMETPRVPGDEIDAIQNPSMTDHTNWPAHVPTLLRGDSLPDGIPRAYLRCLERQQDEFVVKNRRLHRKVTINGVEAAVPYLAKQARIPQMRQLHEMMGHLKSDSITQSLQLRYWWPNLKNDLVAFIRACSTCQLHSRFDRPAPNPMYPLPPPGIPFHTWGIDFMENLPLTDRGNRHVLDAVCYATKFHVAKAVPDTSAKTVALFIYELMLRFGAPQIVISDRGSAFMSQVLQEYLSHQAIAHFPTTPYHPQGNGAIERIHLVLMPIIERMTDGCPNKWDHFLGAANFVMNSRVHTVTGFSPFQLTHGISPRLPGDISPLYVFDFNNESDQVLYTHRELLQLGLNRATALERLQIQADRMAQRHNSRPRVQSQVFAVGDLVKKRLDPAAKFHPRWTASWSGPYVVAAVGQRDVYYLHTLDGNALRNPVNHDLLAPWFSSTDPQELSEGELSSPGSVSSSMSDPDHENAP